jgi:hypothetical protein
MEPPVSDPRPTEVMPAATATAEPPLGPAWDPLGIPWIPRRAERGVLGGRSHGELVAIRLADDHGAGLIEFVDHRGVVGRDVVPSTSWTLRWSEGRVC